MYFIFGAFAHAVLFMLLSICGAILEIFIL
jgi:hypothetical protein